MITSSEKPIGILYEHPQWFNPLFQELERRGIPYIQVQPAYQLYNPAATDMPYSLLYNDMSVPLYFHEPETGNLRMTGYIPYLESRHVQVINGSNALAIESSRSRQLSLLSALGITVPATRVVTHIDYLLPAADELRFPVVLKTERGRGRYLRLFHNMDELQSFILHEHNLPGYDNMFVIQEYITAKGNYFVRIETLNGRFLYALKIHVAGEGFDIWPLEVKQEVFTPPYEMIRQAERIMQAARIDVGSVEYMTDKRNNRTYFFDINARSGYTNDVRNTLGYDPYWKLAFHFERRLSKIREIALAI